MPAAGQSNPEAQSVVSALGRFAPPLELDRLQHFALRGAQPMIFRFAFREVPFRCTAERRDERPVLTLTGDFGALPYTAEGLERRRSVQSILTAARRGSGLGWEVTPQQQIVVHGGISLDLPLTPVAMVAGAVTLLLRARPYLEQLLEVLGQES